MGRPALVLVASGTIGLLALAAAPSWAQVATEPGQMEVGDVATGDGGTPGQLEAAAAFAVEPSITSTQLTARSHSLGAGASGGNLEGTACPANFKMISGSCHPGYTDQVVIINQFPNSGANTWRCGFSNTSGSSRTVWVYTLCGQ